MYKAFFAAESLLQFLESSLCVGLISSNVKNYFTMPTMKRIKYCALKTNEMWNKRFMDSSV